MISFTTEEQNVIKKKCRELNEIFLGQVQTEFEFFADLPGDIFSICINPKSKSCRVRMLKEESDFLLVGKATENSSAFSYSAEKDSTEYENKYRFIRFINENGIETIIKFVKRAESQRKELHDSIMHECGEDTVIDEKKLADGKKKVGALDRRFADCCKAVEEGLGMQGVPVHTSVKLDVEGTCRLEFDKDKHTIYVKENTRGLTSSANNQEHVAKYNVDLKEFRYTANGKSATYDDLAMSTDCSTRFIRSSIRMKEILDEMILMDEATQKKLKQVAYIPNEHIEKRPTVDYNPFKKTHIE